MAVAWAEEVIRVPCSINTNSECTVETSGSLGGGLEYAGVFHPAVVQGATAHRSADQVSKVRYADGSLSPPTKIICFFEKSLKLNLGALISRWPWALDPVNDT